MADKTLRGVAWDHPRGFDPMVATSLAFAEARPDIRIQWERRSLQAFADRPISEMAGTYDLMVIDHPHVGEVARSGYLVDFNLTAIANSLRKIADGSVGLSYCSYSFDGGQWALPIDAAAPVACYRPDLLGWDEVPHCFDQLLLLARSGRVALSLAPINALMTMFGLAANMQFQVAQSPERFIEREHGQFLLECMSELVSLIDARCLQMDPIGIYEWMSRSQDAPAYSPWGYGYTNYSRAGYCEFPLVFVDAPGFGDNGPMGTVLGGTGIAVSADSAHIDVAVEYAFWIASAEQQKTTFFRSGGQPAHAAAWKDPHCNAATHNFFRNTYRTLETAWLRPRYAGYMAFQDHGSEIVHACLHGTLSVQDALERLDSAYRLSHK